MKPSQKTVKCIDWAQIIMDLKRIGMTNREIAAECGHADLDQGGGKYWIDRLKNIPDTQPNFHDGAMLLGVWADRMKKPLAELPRAEYRYVRNASGRVTALPLVDRLLPVDAKGANSRRTFEAD